MRLFRRLFKSLSIFLFVLTIPLFSALFYWNNTLPDLYRSDETTFSFSAHPYITVQTRSPLQSYSANTASDQTVTVSLCLADLIPIKNVSVQTTDERLLIPCGTPFGIKMFTDGVLIVGMSDLQTEHGLKNPAKDAGLAMGDVLVSIDGKAVYSNEDVSAVISQSGGKPLSCCYLRDGVSCSTQLHPVKTDGTYRIGIWVRDSTAGIGTMTYYDPYNGTFGGLGHVICDVDTGKLMPLRNGEIVSVTINDVIKGHVGTPGELRGIFSQADALGSLTHNSESGIFGKLNRQPALSGLIPVGYCHQVENGPAQILSTIGGTTPALYDVSIEKISFDSDHPARNMIIRITDAELLSSTGGIVQGMSGSPIIQNGKLVGAVTHVFVNDPAKGYGIFIENMLDAAG